ncbi:MAG: AMP-binding protein [Clostridia bacterium]|nr:AMP-binding protein [Clostridia bacterium]
MKSIYKKPLYEVKKITDLKDMLEQSAKTFNEKTAFLMKCDGQYMPITYSQFKRDVDALGTALIDLGLKDKRIAVIGENRYEWAVAYMAVVCGTGVVVPLDKELPEDEVRPLIEIADLEAIIYSPKNAKIVESVKINHKINMETDLKELIKKGNELIEKGNREFLDAKIDAEKMSILLFTSGTTSSAKAVMLSHSNICINLMAMCSMINVDINDTMLSILPLHHTYECTCGFLAAIYRGCTVAYCEGLRYIAKNIKEAKATLILCVPLLAENIYRKIWNQAKKTNRADKLAKGIKISNFLRKFGIDKRRKIFSDIHKEFGGKLTRLVSGAAGIDPEIAKGLSDLGIDVVQGYGLTECAPIGALNRFIYFKFESAGLPLPGVEIKIDNPDEDGIGEILIKGGNVMLGYYNNEEATKAVIKDGWFYTGDLGYMDKDSFVYITGRKKNVIVTKNGKNIFPEELETRLCRSPYIAECMVYGQDSEDGDTLVIAQVIPQMDEIEAVLGKTPSVEKIQELLDEEALKVNHQLQLYKRINKVIIRHEEFAKTTTQKIKRHVEMERGEVK